MKETLKALGQNLKNEITVYRLLAKDKRVPKISKALLAIAVFYFFLPFDLIPDFIPVIGHLDDLILIPLLIYLALRFIPAELIAEARQISKNG